MVHSLFEASLKVIGGNSVSDGRQQFDLASNACPVWVENPDQLKRVWMEHFYFASDIKISHHGSKWGRNDVSMKPHAVKMLNCVQVGSTQVNRVLQIRNPKRFLFRLRYLIQDLIRYWGQNVVKLYIRLLHKLLLSILTNFRFYNQDSWNWSPLRPTWFSESRPDIKLKPFS